MKLIPDMKNQAAIDRINKRYSRFARNEARGISPFYEQLALEVCRDESLLDFISSLPVEKQQPNLLFAAVRYLYGAPDSAKHFLGLIARHHESVRALILTRSTQTNEPGRCATLLPALHKLRQPLALLEVGASAGLCLLPDRYSYDYGGQWLKAASPGGSAIPVFPCSANNATPVPARMPEIIWRAGLDLNPIDLNNPEDVRWLEALVWPGQEDRADRLRLAIEIARQQPPMLVKGDLLTDVRGLAALAPPDATLVIFHTAVLGYLRSREDIDRFVSVVNSLDAVWISNESPELFPEAAAKLGKALPNGQFLLMINGDPVAFTGPHGQSIDWF